MRQGAEGIHHVDNFGSEQLRDTETKGILGADCYGMGFLAGACDVGEKEHDVGASCHGVEEVAVGAGGVITRMKIETLERRQSGGQRSSGRK